MKRVASALAVSLTLAGPAGADTLREALARAYNENPTLTGSRAQQRATDENVPIAKAQGRPSLTTQAQVTDNVVRGGNSYTTAERVLQTQLTASVPFYSGGRVKNSVRAAETRVEAGQLGLRGTEANLFTEVVGAYNDVLRDEAIVSLNAQNVRVLETNLQASRDRFQVGDLTRTDVAQSEARLSLAKAQLQRVQATLIGSRENYVRLVGSAPGTLEAPPPLPNLPQDADGAVQVALRDNPTLLAAMKQRDATAYDVRVAKGARLPTLGVGATGSYVNYLGSLGAGTGLGIGQTGHQVGVGLQVQLPLFQGGLPSAQVRQAQASRAQAMENVTAAERQVIASARSAYAIWQSSQLVITSSEEAVAANQLSLEGVRAENSVGNRTILDILNAEQELLNSQVTLVTARRDAYVAGFALLAAMGEAEAQDLGLDTGPLYNAADHYREVRGNWSDWKDGPEAQPVAPGTANIPAQNAEVTRPLDPVLDNGKVDRSPALTTGENAPNR